MLDDRFDGWIAGIGSASGVRIVVGCWARSPFGGFVDVMVADADGRRHLLAPSARVADYVAATYRFDEVVVGPVTLARGATWAVDAPGLRLEIDVGRRRPLGWVLRLVPRRLATSPAWTGLTDPAARLLLRGVRTRGSAGHGRREFYGATDLHAVTGVRGQWRGRPLGGLAPVRPEPDFGFGSTPRSPSLTRIVTTVRRPAADAGPGQPPSAPHRH